jgi:hypothetical protein
MFRVQDSPLMNDGPGLRNIVVLIENEQMSIWHHD